MFPNFLIIGAQKAATNWLVACLHEHPNVFMYTREPPEIHFFNRHFEKGLKWYEAHFADFSDQTAVGEKTPEYLSNPAVPARILASLGEVRLIVSLRDPVKRAYSAYWHYMKRGQIPVESDFATFFRQDWGGLRSQGDYYTHLSRYLDYFPRDKLLVVIYEDIMIKPQQTINECLDFLGLESGFVPKSLNTKKNIGRDVSILHSPIWASWRALKSLPYAIHKPIVEPVIAAGRRIYELLPKQRTYIPLSEDLHQELLEYFLPNIEQLEILLKRDLSMWRAAANVR